MEDLQYVHFSYYYINEKKEIDKVIKNRYMLNNEGILSQKELLKELINHKKLFPKRVSLREILLYHNTQEPVGFFLNKHNDSSLNTINSLQSIEFEPVYRPFHLLTHIYVFFEVKLNGSHQVTQTKKIKYSHGERKSRRMMY